MYVGGVYPTAQGCKNFKMLNNPCMQDDCTHACYICENAELFGVNMLLSQKLQMVQNSAARLTT